MINEDSVKYLRCIWHRLTEKCQCEEMVAAYFDQLVLAYSQSHRHYHNCTHLLHMFGLLQAADVEEDALYWATFYHDYVYQPGRSDNEKASADIADRQMRAMGIAENQCVRVIQLIMATQTHEGVGDDYAASLFLDADMAILGEEPSKYKHYEESVRKEFKAIPTFLFKAGRKKFLLGLLAREQIFIGDWFYARYEQQARENIRGALASS